MERANRVGTGKLKDRDLCRLRCCAAQICALGLHEGAKRQRGHLSNEGPCLRLRTAAKWKAVRYHHRQLLAPSACGSCSICPTGYAAAGETSRAMRLALLISATRRS